MLTRERIEARLQRVATNCQIFASRRTTSIADREWAIGLLADIEALRISFAAHARVALRRGTGDDELSRSEHAPVQPTSGFCDEVSRTGRTDYAMRCADRHNGFAVEGSATPDLPPGVTVEHCGDTFTLHGLSDEQLLRVADDFGKAGRPMPEFRAEEREQ